jgi:hypothetical protein
MMKMTVVWDCWAGVFLLLTEGYFFGAGVKSGWCWFY